VTAARSPSIDIAKGIAIVAIVVHDVLDGLDRAGILDEGVVGLAQSVRLLSMWHLAVFAFLAALFVGRAVDKTSPDAYLHRRLLGLAYLYLVWSVLQGLVKVAVVSLVNTPISLADVVMLWVPEGQLWFLPWLMLMTVASALTRPWRSPGRAALVVAIGTAVSLASWGLNGPVAFTQGLGLTVFFLAGAAWGATRFLTVLLARTTPRILLAGLAAAVLVAIVLGTGAIPPILSGAGRDALSVALGVVAGTAGLVAVLAAASALVRVPLVGTVLALLGRRSLEIFLAHVIASAGLRIALLHLGVTSPVVYLVVGTLGGLALPLVLGRLLEVIHAPWLFHAPAWVTGRADLPVRTPAARAGATEPQRRQPVARNA
jgi:fucose 4-O-acetylase-like acetyltransferase